MFVKSFKRVWGKHAERIFNMKIIVICAIFGIFTATFLVNTEMDLTEISTFSITGFENRLASLDTVGASRFEGYVPILERGFVDDIPVEQGEIILRGGNLPEELPIKITSEVVADWYQIVAVKGGYEPLGGHGIFKNNKDPAEEIAGFKIIPILIEELDCCWVIYNITFEIAEDWCFESSYYPDVADQEGIIPGKLIDICWWTLWQGCDDLNQRFTVLLET
jgi:hypothetical protein